MNMEIVPLPGDDPAASANRELTPDELLTAAQLTREGLQQAIADRAGQPSALEHYLQDRQARTSE